MSLPSELGGQSSEQLQPTESSFTDMKSLLSVDKETSKGGPELLRNTEYFSISLRRHGRYERGDNVSYQRGQLTKETIPEVRENAAKWVADLPEDVELHIVNSPTFMPGEGKQGERIEPKRAKATGAIYGSELRKRFGEGYGYLADDSLSESHREIRKSSSTVEHQGSRQLDSRVGDIFENTTKEESEFVPDFFKKLSETYGGLTPDFWRDFIQGELPTELNEIYLKAGGDPAIEKAAMAVGVVIDMTKEPHDSRKQVGLIISHEEVIGSLAYQISEYLKDRKEVDDSTLEVITGKKFSYNEGFDIHVGEGGQAIISIEGNNLELDLSDFKSYLEEKAHPNKKNDQ